MIKTLSFCLLAIERIAMKKLKEEINHKKKPSNEKPVSLYPIEFEEALGKLLEVSKYTDSKNSYKDNK